MDEIYVLTYNGAFVYDYHKGLVADGFKRVVNDWFDIEWEHSYRKMNYKKRDFKIKKFVFTDGVGAYLLRCERVQKRNRLLRKALQLAAQAFNELHCNGVGESKDIMKRFLKCAKQELKPKNKKGK